MTIEIEDTMAEFLLRATNSDSLESAVMTALNGRLHMMGYEFQPKPSTRESWRPPNQEEIAEAAANAKAGIEAALRRIDGDPSPSA